MSRSSPARHGWEIAANKTPPPWALRAALQAPAARLIGCIRRQNPPLRGVPGAPRSSPPNPPANRPVVTHLMSEALRRGI